MPTLSKSDVFNLWSRFYPTTPRQISMTNKHSVILILIVLALTGLCLSACSSGNENDSDSGSRDSGSQLRDASDGQSDGADISGSGCGTDQYRHPETEQCQSCPAPAFNCDLVQLDQSSVDLSTNVVEIVLAADSPQITTATGSGMKNTGEGPGGTFSEPMSVQGTVDRNILTFDFSDYADGDELQLSKVRIQEPCSEEAASANINVTWEPNGEVTSSLGCLPGLNR